jgi:hypothetical protein
MLYSGVLNSQVKPLLAREIVVCDGRHDRAADILLAELALLT